MHVNVYMYIPANIYVYVSVYISVCIYMYIPIHVTRIIARTCANTNAMTRLRGLTCTSFELVYRT